MSSSLARAETILPPVLFVPPVVAAASSLPSNVTLDLIQDFRSLRQDETEAEFSSSTAAPDYTGSTQSTQFRLQPPATMTTSTTMTTAASVVNNDTSDHSQDEEEEDDDYEPTPPTKPPFLEPFRLFAAEFKRDHANLVHKKCVGDLSRITGKAWRNLSLEEKQFYAQRIAPLKHEYNMELNLYRHKVLRHIAKQKQTTTNKPSSFEEEEAGTLH